MAKLVSSGKGAPLADVLSDNPSRGDMELQIGIRNEWLWNNTPVTGLLNVATIRCDYYSINVNETTYGNTTKEVKTNMTATFFNKINNFILYQRDGNEIEDSNGTDRALNIHLGPKQSVIIGQTQVVPKENDHIILQSQSKLGLYYPFRVTKVSPILFNQQESFLIEYSQSQIFKNAEELDYRVVKEYDFIEKNVGTGNQVLFDKETSDNVSALTDIFNRLAVSYTQAFYDDEKDVAAFKWEIFPDREEQNIRPNKYWFMYGALKLFQEKVGALKYGFYSNTLFIGSSYPIPREETNYNHSLYIKLIDKEFCKVEEESGYTDNACSEAMHAFEKAFIERDYYNEDHGIEYTPRYSYRTKLYFLENALHSILNRFYMSKIITVDMIEKPDISDLFTRSAHIHYVLKSPAICRVLDAYMDGDNTALMNAIMKLKRYSIDKENIDDYMGIPLLLYAISSCIDTASGTSRNTYYG